MQERNVSVLKNTFQEMFTMGANSFHRLVCPLSAFLANSPLCPFLSMRKCFTEEALAPILNAQ